MFNPFISPELTLNLNTFIAASVALRAFMAGILVIMYLTPGIQISVLLIPVWIVVLAIGYQLKLKRQGRLAADLG